MFLCRNNMASFQPSFLIGCAALVALGAASPAGAQDTHRANPETSPRERNVADAVVEPGPKPLSMFGTRLSRAEARALLGEMRQMTEQALATSRAAEQAASVAEIKNAAGQVLQAVWGVAPGRPEGSGTGEIAVPGWKERWQVTGAEWGGGFAERYGTAPPRVTDPRQLGIMGRGRAVRGHLGQTRAAEPVVASLNNVIGWTYITEGLKVRENQPRISLTYVWDAPSEFWQSSADTGWLDEVYSQAANILKTNYNNDVAEARRHAAGMTELLQKVLAGVDADKSGTVEPKMMEGGLHAALQAAGQVGR